MHSIVLNKTSNSHANRICPGKHFAQANVFITCASILSAFDITPKQVNGKATLPEYKATTGVIRYDDILGRTYELTLYSFEQCIAIRSRLSVI